MKSFLMLLLLTIALIPQAARSQSSASRPAKIVYQSDGLTIAQLTESVYVHTSFLRSDEYGKVPCNGMIVASDNEAVIFDTPPDGRSSAELISWLQENRHYKINGVIATHFHEDCVGGLDEFHKNTIATYATTKTIELVKEHGFDVPSNGFKDSLTLIAGGKKVHARFFGEGHTRDNIVGYFPADKVLFGGCLIKELDASKGNLADANVHDWSATVSKLKRTYPDVDIVIPGHGSAGNRALLDYTIKLFQNKN